jgi:adenylate kinase family enzyme
MRIALAGNVESGKSTIAAQLQKRGYHFLNYTELIKKELANAMADVGVTSTFEEALEKLHKEKEFYRPLLIAWADTTGWSTGDRLKGLLDSLQTGDVVLDNIRFLRQAEIVKAAGFIILKLEGGKSVGEAYDKEFEHYHFDAVIPWMENVEKRIEYILAIIPQLQK